MAKQKEPYAARALHQARFAEAKKGKLRQNSKIYFIFWFFWKEPSLAKHPIGMEWFILFEKMGRLSDICVLEGEDYWIII